MTLLLLGYLYVGTVLVVAMHVIRPFSRLAPTIKAALAFLFWPILLPAAFLSYFLQR